MTLPAAGAVALLPPQPADDAQAQAARGVIRRLTRSQSIPDELLAALDGPLGQAIASAAAYAGDALSAPTKKAYARDWEHFATWCRSQAVDPSALPIHPVFVAAYLAALTPTVGKSALNGRVAAIAYEHRRRGHT